MITRAQAEALLTLAESLEACERLNMEVGMGSMYQPTLDFSDTLKEFASMSQLTAGNVRTVVAALIPKRET